MEKKITLKDRIKNEIELAWRWRGTIPSIHKHFTEEIATPIRISLDTVRKAVKELVDEGKMKWDDEEGFRYYQNVKEVPEESSPEEKALLEKRKEIERLTERTRFDKNWKLRTVRQVLLAEKVVARHEMAAIIGSDIKNTHMMVTFLKNGQTKYPAMNIEYNKRTREYTLVETQE